VSRLLRLPDDNARRRALDMAHEMAGGGGGDE
jgi:hypothetical protein